MSILPSATNTINSLVLQKKMRGEQVYNFAVGDIIIPNHPSIVEATLERVKKGIFPYAPFAGLPELRHAASEWMNRKYACSFSLENTLITPGGKFALYAALRSILSAGDEVLIPVPYWVSYPSIVNFCGGKTVFLSAGWKVTIEDLESKVTPRTKVLLFNNACNPTGVLYTKEEIQAISDFAKKRGITIISDEVYSELVFDGNQFHSFGSEYAGY